MMNIKEKIFKFVLKRQPARKVSIPNWEKVRTIAIIYSHEDIPHIINQLLEIGVRSVNVCTWLTKRWVTVNDDRVNHIFAFSH
jgi:hypothetical protein